MSNSKPVSAESEGFQTAESEAEAMDTLESLESEDTMLKLRMVGDGILAGTDQTVRPYAHQDDRLQVETEVLGRVSWFDTDVLAQEIHEKRLPYKVVDWEARFQ